MTQLDTATRQRFLDFAHRLVDPTRASVLIPARAQEPGHWFGGGNVTEGPDGALYIVGRYRVAGDSRTGVGAGQRGNELALFRSTDGGASTIKILSLSKQDLSREGNEVLSIEGSALHWTTDGVELFVSTEKAGIPYPHELATFQKPGTGVWTIDRLSADGVTALATADVDPVLSSSETSHLHVKDPNLYERPGGDVVMLFCSHPFSWSSSNTGYAVRSHGQRDFGEAHFAAIPRGCSWDVAITRATAVVDVPWSKEACGADVALVFYDGGESMRDLDEHTAAVRRPRGYSCEELGGVGIIVDGELATFERLAIDLPSFVSPHGTGSCRYVSVCSDRDAFYATWQQSQADGSQPLVLNVVNRNTH